MDDKGILQTREPFKYTVEITGFEAIEPTKISQDVTIENFNNKLGTPASFYNDVNGLQDIIVANKRNIFKNVPQELFESATFKDALKITPVSYSNSEGYLVVKIALYQYYNHQGELITNDEPLVENVKLSGFTPSFGTVIDDFQPIPLNSQSTTLPSAADAYNLVINNYALFIHNLPPPPPTPDNPGFEPTKDINVQVLEANDVLGTLTVKVLIKNFYDSNGEINQSGRMSGIITFKGFAQEQASIFSAEGHELNVGSFDQVNITASFPNTFASEINDFYTTLSTGPTLADQQKVVNEFLYSIVESRISHVKDKSPTNIIVTLRENQFSNQAGYLEVAVNIKKYISYQEGGKNSSPCNFVVRIYGFKKQLTAVYTVNQAVVIASIVLGVVAILILIALIVFVFRFRI